MSNNLEPITDPGQPSIYRIRVKGLMCSQWTGWFECLTITLEEDGDMLLAGPQVDRAGLRGLLKSVRDLGLPLTSVNSIGPDQAEASVDNP